MSKEKIVLKKQYRCSGTVYKPGDEIEVTKEEKERLDSLDAIEHGNVIFADEKPDEEKEKFKKAVEDQALHIKKLQDKIDKQQEANEALEADNMKLEAQYSNSKKEIADLKKENAKLKKDNEELKKKAK